jgi:hypothetical protein
MVGAVGVFGLADVALRVEADGLVEEGFVEVIELDGRVRLGFVDPIGAGSGLIVVVVRVAVVGHRVRFLEGRDVVELALADVGGGLEGNRIAQGIRIGDKAGD